MDQIIVKNLEVFCHHGVYKEENGSANTEFVNNKINDSIKKNALFIFSSPSYFYYKTSII